MECDAVPSLPFPYDSDTCMCGIHKKLSSAGRKWDVSFDL